MRSWQVEGIASYGFVDAYEHKPHMGMQTALEFFEAAERRLPVALGSGQCLALGGRSQAGWDECGPAVLSRCWQVAEWVAPHGERMIRFIIRRLKAEFGLEYSFGQVVSMIEELSTNRFLYLIDVDLYKWSSLG